VVQGRIGLRLCVSCQIDYIIFLPLTLTITFPAFPYLIINQKQNAYMQRINAAKKLGTLRVVARGGLVGWQCVQVRSSSGAQEAVARLQTIARAAREVCMHLWGLLLI